MAWSTNQLRSLRLRLGWSQSEMARRLSIRSEAVDAWERGVAVPSLEMHNELEFILRQAEEVRIEVQSSCLVDDALDKKAIDQIEFSHIKETIE